MTSLLCWKLSKEVAIYQQWMGLIGLNSSLSDSSLFQNHHPVNKAYLLTAISSTVSFVPTLD